MSALDADIFFLVYYAPHKLIIVLWRLFYWKVSAQCVNRTSYIGRLVANSCTLVATRVRRHRLWPWQVTLSSTVNGALQVVRGNTCRRGWLEQFLQQTVPLHDLLVDVGRHPVPMVEFFAAWEHERPEHDATNHTVCIHECVRAPHHHNKITNKKLSYRLENGASAVCIPFRHNATLNNLFFLFFIRYIWHFQKFFST